MNTTTIISIALQAATLLSLIRTTIAAGQQENPFRRDILGKRALILGALVIVSAVLDWFILHESASTSMSAKLLAIDAILFVGVIYSVYSEYVYRQWLTLKFSIANAQVRAQMETEVVVSPDTTTEELQQIWRAKRLLGYKKVTVRQSDDESEITCRFPRP